MVQQVLKQYGKDWGRLLHNDSCGGTKTVCRIRCRQQVAPRLLHHIGGFGPLLVPSTRQCFIQRSYVLLGKTQPFRQTLEAPQRHKHATSCNWAIDALQVWCKRIVKEEILGDIQRHHQPPSCQSSTKEAAQFHSRHHHFRLFKTWYIQFWWSFE